MSEEHSTGVAPNRLVGGLIAILAILVVGLLVWVLLLLRGGDTAVSGTPTPFANNQTAPPVGEPLVVGLDGTSAISVTLDAPLTLSLNGQSFAIQPQTVSEDRVWTPNITEENSGVWVYGTVVNYVIGLPNSDINRRLLEQLQLGDEMTLETLGGLTYTFSFDSRRTVLNSDQSVFNQNVPGVTLLLLGAEGSERMVVNGRYLLTESDTEAANVVTLGETAQLENIQITVPSVAYVPDRAEIPDGFAFFQIDYELQNVGLTAFDTSQLRLTLVDSIGNQYALNPVASQVGNFPSISGFVNAGQVVQATAGYQIPIGLSSEALSWVVSKADSGAQLQVTIPFTGNASTASRNTSVMLQQATVGADLTTLVLAGQLTNLNSQPIVVTQSDLALNGEDGTNYLLISTNPPLPWSIGAGQTFSFGVTYQRPATETAVFTIFAQEFQLTGLR